jgi:hypothetical protein
MEITFNTKQEKEAFDQEVFNLLYHTDNVDSRKFVKQLKDSAIVPK